MLNRFCSRALLLAGLALPFAGCSTTPSLTSIAVSPSTVTATPGVTFQLTAIGSYTRPNHATVTRDITSEVTWASSSAQMVTVSSTGFAETTGKSTGNSTISASAPGFHGIIVGYSDVVVTEPTTNARITSIALRRPQFNFVLSQEEAPFKITGKTATGDTVDLTERTAKGEFTWSSSNSETAAIDATTGQVKPLTSGTTTITAVFKNPDGTMAIGTSPLRIDTLKIASEN